jgi:RNA polymerase sigma-70 factor (ECF subfamily)
MPRFERPGPEFVEFQQLLRAARAGSGEALGTLLDRYRPLLLRLARSGFPPNLQPKGGASDLVQETFLNAHRGFARFHGTSQEELSAWLRRILVRNLSSFRRTYVDRSKRRAALEVSLSDSRGQIPSGRDRIVGKSSPPAELVDQEQKGRLQAAIRALPGPYRQVVYLHSWGQLTFEAVGKELGCSAEAARKLHTRAVNCLAASLSPSGKVE